MTYDIKQIIKDTVSIGEVVEQLGGLDLKGNGNGLQGDCPTGHDSQHHRCFSVNLMGNYYHCFSCGIGGDIIDLVEVVKGIEFEDALKWLVEEFRPELLPELKTYKPDLSSAQREYYQKASFYDLIYEYGKGLLYDAVGKEALNYLIDQRGYKIENLKQTDWIYYPTDKEIRDYLLSQHPEATPELNNQIKALPLQGHFGDNFRLAFPYRDRRGAITGFVKRTTEAKGRDLKGQTGVRYDSTTGLIKHDLFNLHSCRKEDELLIVEGYPDAFYLPTLGIKNIVAAGQGLLSKNHIEGLLAFNVKRVIISFDNDPGTKSGLVNTDKAVDLLRSTPIKAFVVDPFSLTPHKDPDEFVRDKGSEAFKRLVNNAESGANWKAKYLVSKYQMQSLETALGKERLVAEALEWVAIHPETKAREEEDFLKIIAEATGYDIHSLITEWSGAEKKKVRERLKKGYRDFIRESSRLLKENKIADLQRLLEGKIKNLRIDFEENSVKPSKPLSEHLKEKYESDSQREGELLGYKLNKFKTLAQDTQGIQPGFYIVGADTNIGKTAFLTNIFLDLLDSNPETKGIYFSFDDNQDVIINRFVAIRASLSLNSIRRKQKKEADQLKIEEAYTALIRLAEEKRVDIKDLSEIDNMDSLELAIRERSDSNLFVFIDGLYNVSVGRGNSGIREENVERADRIKALVDIYRIPIIASAEVRKRQAGEKPEKQLTTHDIMETGKYGYNATLAWMLYPETNYKEFKQKEEPILLLNYDKNKISPFKGSRKLKFIRTKGIIEEIL